ncbi:MAG: hypothetical protein GY857_09195, partial [Desulfobacula sp.]|nr:hypothetical protein [Desulfobacula sp.]
MMCKKRIAVGIMVLLTGMIFMLEPSFAARSSEVFIGVTTGSRKIINHNIQQAKKKAVSDALDIAVQKAFVSLVPRQVMASNLDFFYDKILSHTSDYIITYRVLGGIENNNHYLVGVESKVDLALLEQTLVNARIINTSQDKPVIMFFIVEKTPSDLLSKYWWGKNPIPYQSIAEKIIINKMIQGQFIITGDTDPRPDPSFYNITFDSIYDIEAAKNLGREMKADMIIFGKAVSSEAINRMGEEKAFNSEINLQGYYLETGEKAIDSRVQAVAKSNLAQEGNSLAISKAADISSVDLIGKINTFWMQNLRQEHAFDVNIQGENFLARFIALKQKLKQMPEIENMQPREMGSDYAVIQVFYKGKATQFADMIMLKTFESFGLEISDVSDN